MQSTDAKEIKGKIISILKIRGPSLPVQISHQTGISSIFAGAFLSELAKENMLKISNMKVGGSPLYYIQGQEHLLENFYTYMPGKEKEAFLLLKEKKILKDKKQQPAIRVALRNLKDFAFSFSKDNEIWWHFYSVTEEQVRELLEPLIEKEKLKEEKLEKQIEKPAIKITPEIKATPKIELAAEPEKLEIKEEKLEKPKEIEIEIKPKKPMIERTLDIFDKTAEKLKTRRKKQAPEKFFEEVKSSLREKNIELVSIESYNKKELIAKIRFNLAPEKMHLLIAYDKKRIDEKDLLKAYKKSLQYKLDYVVFFKGEMPKRLKDYIDAYKNLVSTDKIGL